MDSADPRRRRLARSAPHDPDQAWRWARERQRGGPPAEVLEHLAAPTVGDGAELRAWLEGFVRHGAAWLIMALSVVVQACWEELGEAEWAPEDAAAAAWACAFAPSASQRAQALVLAAEADALADRTTGEVSLVAAAAARLARLAGDHQPSGSPKPMVQQAWLVARALLASGIGPGEIQARARAGVSVNRR